MHNKNTRHVYDYERFVHLKNAPVLLVYWRTAMMIPGMEGSIMLKTPSVGGVPSF